MEIEERERPYLTDTELFDIVFKPGAIIIVYGRMGRGKSNNVCEIMSLLSKKHTVFTNIMFHRKRLRPGRTPPPQSIQYIKNLREYFYISATERAAWFESATDEQMWDYTDNKYVPGLPTFGIMLDEAKDFLEKLSTNSREAKAFIKKFVPMLRKLGSGAALIYHGKGETVKDLRADDGGQFLAGEIECTAHGQMEIRLSCENYPELFEDGYKGQTAPFVPGPIPYSGIPMTSLSMDTNHTATFSITDGIDVGELWRAIAEYESQDAPTQIVEYLDSLEKEGDAEDGLSLDDKATKTLIFAQMPWHMARGKKMTKSLLIEMLDESSSNLYTWADKEYPGWKENWSGNG